MLLRTLEGLASDPVAALISLLSFAVALVIGITVHEFSHALAATRLGDYTAQRQGRLTLDPRAHLDPLGTILIFIAGFGWGKPTPFSPWNLRVGQRTGMAIVSLAGPISNVIVAGLIALPLRLGIVSGVPSGYLGILIGSLIFWNLLLAAFNLLPIAPLDGFKIVLGLLPRDLANSFAATERYGPVILMLVIIADVALGTGILPRIIIPIISFLQFLIVG